ncbi:hypothetical protein ANO11243_033460 [Dothideomycetidae sp. 11243]|nr:hypothetical protein ANO11243_033460 [fungal sp. No.11243]
MRITDVFTFGLGASTVYGAHVKGIGHKKITGQLTKTSILIDDDADQLPKDCSSSTIRTNMSHLTSNVRESEAFCKFFLSEHRTTSPFAVLTAEALTTTCICNLQSRGVAVPSYCKVAIPPGPPVSSYVCDSNYQTALTRQFPINALGFCQWFAGIPCNLSPVSAIPGNAQMKQGCKCIEAAAAALSSTTTSTKKILGPTTNAPPAATTPPRAPTAPSAAPPAKSTMTTLAGGSAGAGGAAPPANGVTTPTKVPTTTAKAITTKTAVAGNAGGITTCSAGKLLTITTFMKILTQTVTVTWSQAYVGSGSTAADAAAKRGSTTTYSPNLALKDIVNSCANYAANVQDPNTFAAFDLHLNQDAQLWYCISYSDGYQTQDFEAATGTHIGCGFGYVETGIGGAD